MITIPSNQLPILKQDNRSNRLGNITESFNLELRDNLTGIRVNRSKLIYSNNDSAAFDFSGLGYVALGTYSGSYYTVSTAVWEGGNSAFDTPSSVSSTPSISDEGDTISFNDRAWVSGETSLWYSASGNLGGSWTEVTSSGLTANTSHLLAVLGNRLYVTDNNDEVHTVNSSNAYTSTGTGTLNLGLNGYSITALMAGSDRVWVAASPTGDNGQAQICWVYEWDGESENNPTRKYPVQTQGILGGVMVNDVPYLLDVKGRLLAFRGADFSEVARFPLEKDELLWGVGQAILRNRAIHPRGMIYDGDEILIHINNRIENSTSTPAYTSKFSGGVWAWNPDNGLYHKFSSSYVDTSDTGTNITDYGQSRVERVGPIIEFRPNNKAATDGGSYIWSASFFDNADSGAGDGITGIFTDDTFDNTQKWGYFITSQIFSQDMLDVWQKIYTIYKKLITSTDKIVVKYRTEDDVPTEASITWVDTDTFTTTTDVSSYVEGDEVQIIQGVGGGKSAHISSISEAGGTYTVNLDDTFTGATTTTAKAFFSKWVKAGEITQTNDTEQYKGLTLMEKNTSPFVQFKVCMQFTGENEIYKHVVVNKKVIKE